MGAKADWFDEAEDHVPAAAPKAAAKSGDWFDSADDADDESAQVIEPQNINEPRDESWLGRAAKGINKWPGESTADKVIEGVDYVPIVGPIVTDTASGYDQKEIKRHRDSIDAYAKKYPESHFAKSILSNAPLLLAPELASVKALAGRTIPKALARIVAAAGENAALQGTDSLLRGKSGEQSLEDAGNAAAFGAIAKAVPETIKQIVIKGGHYVSNIKPAEFDKYISRNKEVNELNPQRMFDELGGDIRAIQEKGAEHQATLKDQIKRANYDRRDNADEAIQDAKNKAHEKKREAYDFADRLDRDTAERMSADQIEARKQVSKHSSDAFDILDRSGVRIPLSPMLSTVEQQINSMRTGRVLDTKQPEIRYLLKQRLYIKSMIEKNPDGAISAVDMKKITQRLDRDSESAYIAGSLGKRDDAMADVAKELRNRYDLNLKKIEPYREAMIITAKKSAALNEFQRHPFSSSSDKIFNVIRGIEGLGSKDKLLAIRKFEDTFGFNYRDALESSKNMRNQQFDIEVDPEVKAAREARRSNAKDSPKAVAQQKLINDYLKNVKGLSPDQAVNILKRYGDNPEDSIREVVALTPKLKGIGRQAKRGEGYYPQMAEDYATKRAFSGDRTNGSRLTNAFKVIFGAVGAKVGGATGGATGAALGTTAGLAADRVGTHTFKAILDFASSGPGQVARGVLAKAAQRGPQAFIAAHYTLMNTNQEYKNAIENPASDMDKPMPDDWYESLPQN